MAALPTFHPCQFNFKTTNIRRVGAFLSGGKSLSGFEDSIEADGGGYLQADFSNGSTRTKNAGNAWRAITDLDGGEQVIVLLCAERLFQPVGALQKVTHDDGTTFDDATLYASPGAQFAAAADAALRATSMVISGTSELALIGGELFSIEHPNWGWRAYRVRTVVDNDDGTFAITFRTPLREAVTSGTALEFDTPRCQMVIPQKVDNSTDMGRYGTCSITFVEDMSNPATS